MRPCPWVTCRYHLLLDVNVHGGLRLHLQRGEATAKRTLRQSRDATFFDRWAGDALKRLSDMAETCALDVAERAEREGITFNEIGALIGTTREGARQSAENAVAKLRPFFGDELVCSMQAALEEGG